MNIKTKFGAAITTGALILSTLAPVASANGNHGGWMNDGWWKDKGHEQHQSPMPTPTPMPSHNPWGDMDWHFPQSETNIDVNTEINQNSFSSFENNVSIIGSTGS